MRADEKSGEDRSPRLRLLHVLIEQAEFRAARDHAGKEKNSNFHEECFFSAPMQ
jgi:hypothetical protein